MYRGVTAACYLVFCVVRVSPAAAEPSVVTALPYAVATTAIAEAGGAVPAPRTWIGASPRTGVAQQVAWVNEVAVVEPAPAPGWSGRLKAAVPADSAALLSGDDGSGAMHPPDDPETMALLIETATLLASKERNAAQAERLRQLCLWLAAPAFDEILRLAAAQEPLRVLAAVRPHVPFRDASTERLTLTVPVPHAAHQGAPIQFAFRDGVVDYWSFMRDREAPERSVDDYRAWRSTGDFAIEFPWRANEVMQREVSIQAHDSTLGAILTALGDQTGRPGWTVDPTLLDRKVSVNADSVPLGDVVTAISRVTGTALVPEGAGLRLTRPTEVRDRLLAAAPLSWWAWTQRSQYEIESAREAWRLAFWRELDAATRRQLEGGYLVLAELPEPLRGTLAQLLELRCGEAFKLFLLDLPAGDSVPVVLQGDQPRRNWYRLTARTFENLVGCVYSTVLEQALRGGQPLDFRGPGGGTDAP